MNQLLSLFFKSIIAGLLGVCLLWQSSNAQQTPPKIEWQKSLGGTRNDDANSIERTSDGGYIVAGWSWSNDGDATQNYGQYDFWIVKLTSVGGIEWQKSYGGSGDDRAYSIAQTADGGYIAAGYTYSTDGDVTRSPGAYNHADYWIVKLTSAGVIEWQVSLGGGYDDKATSIQQASDGGYIVGGTRSFKMGSSITTDYWIMKLTSTGEIEWQKTLGGSGDDKVNSIEETSDGGCIVAGWSFSTDGDVARNYAMSDYWILKLTNTGEIEWQKTLGGDDWDKAASIAQTSDGGYIVAGWSTSIGGDITDHYGGSDYWVVKLTSTGEIEWERSLGGSHNDEAHSIAQTSDGGYIIAGESYSNNVDVTENYGQYDYWIVKLTGAGVIEWQKSLGGSRHDGARSIQQDSDGGYIVAGSSFSREDDITGHHGTDEFSDYWIVKIAPASPVRGKFTGLILEGVDPDGKIRADYSTAFTWSTDTSIPGIKTIEISEDNGRTWSPVPAVTATGDVTTVEYTTPSHSIEQARFRIYSASDKKDMYLMATPIQVGEPTWAKIEWQRALGGSEDDYAASIAQTNDGGCIVAGYSRSTDGDVTGHHKLAGNINFWIVKLTSLGEIQWQRPIGGSREDRATAIQQTSDSGYIIVGYSHSADGDVAQPRSFSDYWIVKLTSTGDLQWQKSVGWGKGGEATSIEQTSDGGYIIAGYSYFTDSDTTGDHGLGDYWIMKLTSTGDLQWQKKFGGSSSEQPYSIKQTTDGGYIIAGYSDSRDGDVTGHHGSAGYSDYWIVKLSSSGGIEWQKSLGGVNDDKATSIQQTSDGGYIVAGSSYSVDGDVIRHHETISSDYWIVKLTSAGVIEWQKLLGGVNDDKATSILQTSDGGYIVAGYSNSNDGDVAEWHGGYDYWIVKITSAGGLAWQKSLGGWGSDEAYSIAQTTDGGYVVAGRSKSTNDDVSGNHGEGDYWIVKIIPPTSDINRFTSLILQGVDPSGKITTNYPTAFTWSTNKKIPGTKTIEISENNGRTWLPTPAATAAGTVTTAQYTTPAHSITQALFRIYSAADKRDMYTMTTPIQVVHSAAVQHISGIPSPWAMNANYPNPFSSTTTITFTVPERSFVRLSVDNEQGVEVARLIEEHLEAGEYRVPFSGEGLASGTYLYRLTSGSTSLVGKMTVVR